VATLAPIYLATRYPQGKGVLRSCYSASEAEKSGGSRPGLEIEIELDDGRQMVVVQEKTINLPLATISVCFKARTGQCGLDNSNYYKIKEKLVQNCMVKGNILQFRLP